MNYARAGTVLAVLIGAVYISANPPTGHVQGYGPGFSPDLSLLKDIRDDIRGLRQDIRAIVGGGGSSGALGVGNHEQIIKARCAKCHESAVAESEGGDFTLLDAGKIEEFSKRDAILIGKRVTSTTRPMPPGGGLSEAEKKVLSNIPYKGRKP